MLRLSAELWFQITPRGVHCMQIFDIDNTKHPILAISYSPLRLDCGQIRGAYTPPQTRLCGLKYSKVFILFLGRQLKKAPFTVPQPALLQHLRSAGKWQLRNKRRLDTQTAFSNLALLVEVGDRLSCSDVTILSLLHRTLGDASYLFVFPHYKRRSFTF